MKKKGAEKVKVAVNDKCAKCADFWSTTCCKFMTWEEFCDKRWNSPVFRLETDEAMQIDLSTPPTCEPTSIHSKMRIGIRVSQDGMIMDRAEIQEKLKGRTPESVGLKLEKFPDVTNKVTSGIAFLDPQARYKRFTAFAECYDEQDTEKMSASSCRFKSQCEKAFAFVYKDRVKNGRKNILNSELQSLDELELRLAKSLQQAELADNPELAAVVGDGPGGQSGDGSGDETEREVVGQSFATSGAGPRASPVKGGARSSAESSHRGSLGRGVVAASGSVVTEPDGDDAMNESVGMAMPPSYWINKISLSAVLCGTRYGREKGFAATTVDKMQAAGKETGAKLLRTHLKQVAICEQLTASRLPNMPSDELRKLLSEISDVDLDFPSDLKKALLIRRITQYKDMTQNGR